LVDDQQQDLVALETILKPLEYSLLKASSGGEALKVLLKKEVAVIMIDVEMPDMDGFQIAAIIRNREKTRYTPIIFLAPTQKSDPPMALRHSLGCVDYILKPIVPDLLQTKVAAFVEMFKLGQEAQKQSLLLKAERDFAAAILDTVAGFVLVLDDNGRILRVNRGFEEATDYRLDQVRGHFLHEYLEDMDTAK